nr:branched-chain amino acid ABC transporter permease [Nitrosomonas nitrosa]
MLSQSLQYVFAGLTVGAIYALIGVGFSIIYNARQMINFAQGEFVMIGGMATAFLLGVGMPLILAIGIALVIAVVVGALIERFGVETARNASVITLIIITLGASILLRGVAQLVWGREFHSLPAFSGTQPISVLGATVLPQTLWVLGITVLVVLALNHFFGRTLFGKAMRATSYNHMAARLVGINIRFVYLLNFALAALLGALAGVLSAPITLTSFEVGIMLGLKGFAAAILGGLGNPLGAVAGGLIVGLVEGLTAGYLSSAYKDAVAFVIVLGVLFFLPGGLFGRPARESL